MADKTKNLGLTKPARDDYYDIDVFNDNFDKIDADARNFGACYKIGDTVETLRTDLGDNWALTNGEKIDRTKYPQFYRMMAKSHQQYIVADTEKIIFYNSNYKTFLDTQYFVNNQYLFFHAQDANSNDDNTEIGQVQAFDANMNYIGKYTYRPPGSYYDTGRLYYLNETYIFRGTYRSSSGYYQSFFTLSQLGGEVTKKGGFSADGSCNSLYYTSDMYYDGTNYSLRHGNKIFYSSDLKTWKSIDTVVNANDIIDYVYAGGFYIVIKANDIFYATSLTGDWSTISVANQSGFSTGGTKLYHTAENKWILCKEVNKKTTVYVVANPTEFKGAEPIVSDCNFKISDIRYVASDGITYLISAKPYFLDFNLKTESLISEIDIRNLSNLKEAGINDIFYDDQGYVNAYAIYYRNDSGSNVRWDIGITFPQGSMLPVSDSAAYKYIKVSDTND